MENYIDRIKEELDRIEKPEWLNTIFTLIENFAEYPLDEENKPDAAIYEILSSLDRNDSPEVRFINQMGYIHAFTYRAYYLDNERNAVYWNPLKEKYTEFKKNATQIYQASMEYPAADIIHKWLFSQFNQVQP